MTTETEEHAGQLLATDDAGAVRRIDLFQTLVHTETAGGVRKTIPTMRRAECDGEDVAWKGEGRYQMADGTILTVQG